MNLTIKKPICIIEIFNTSKEHWIEELKILRDKYKISIAGEGGEYESFVLDSPLFKKRIQIENIETEMDSEHSGIITKCEATLVRKWVRKIY